jgi:dCMP deaminase
MRASWDDYFMRIAREVATRATCDRKHVGAVIVRDRNALATGYNGSIRGTDHCDDAGHLMVDGHCVRTIHAELNAILQAAKNGTRIEGATIYVTASPCWSCFQAISNAGITRIVYGEPYRADDDGPKRVRAVAAELGIELLDLSTKNLPHGSAPKVAVDTIMDAVERTVATMSKEDADSFLKSLSCRVDDF